MSVRWVRAETRIRTLRASVNGDTGTPASDPEDRASLPPRLRALVQQARVLRMIAATPLHRVRVPLLGASPASRRERGAAYDRAVLELRRAIWDWRNAFGALDGEEVRLLAASGIAGVPLAGVLLGGLDRTRRTWEGPWVRQPPVERAARLLAAVDAELRRFERALLSVGRDPYRALA